MDPLYLRPESSVIVEEMTWETANFRRVLHVVAQHTVSGSFRVQPGPRIYRLSPATRVGFTLTASSKGEFEMGGEEVPRLGVDSLAID